MDLNLVVLGPPGAGKGTQAERIAREFGIPRVSTGDILRDAVQTGTDLGRLAQETMAAGRLVSDEVMIGIIGERLAQDDARTGFVLDGFPRTVTQAEALEPLVEDRDPLIVVDIVVPCEELVRRLHSRRICARCGQNAPALDANTACARCGGELVQRGDDGEAVVRERLLVYGRDTQPLVDYYRQRRTFRSINGNQPPDAVAAEIRGAIESARAVALSAPARAERARP